LTLMGTRRTQTVDMQSFTDIIDLFDGPAAFGREIGMDPNTAKQAKRRNSLSPRWFAATARAARRRVDAGDDKFRPIDERLLAELAEARRVRSAATKGSRQ
jgi:hypothetical protein